MKSFVIKSFFFLTLITMQLAVFAQQNLKQTNNDIKNWLTENWLWVAGGAIVLVIIIVASSNGRRSNRKTTTIVKDDLGNVKSITSTEIRES